MSPKTNEALGYWISTCVKQRNYAKAQTKKKQIVNGLYSSYSRELVSTIWQTDSAIMEVFPVPDWACAMTSRPLTMGRTALCWMAEGFSNP